jgi:hypothetical protein
MDNPEHADPLTGVEKFIVCSFSTFSKLTFRHMWPPDKNTKDNKEIPEHVDPL